MRRSSIGWLCASMWVVCGCVVVRSAPQDVNELGRGLTYYLPKREVKVTAERKLLKKEDLQKAIATKKTELAATTARLTETLGLIARARARLASGAVQNDAEAKATIASELAIAVADSTSTHEKKKAVEREVAEAEASLAIIEAAPKAICVFSYSAAVELLPPVADTRHRFVASVAHRWQRDDQVKLVVNGAGLLSSANAVSHDRTGDILVELAGAVAGLGAGTGALNLAMTDSSKAPDAMACAELPPKFAHRLDPAAPAEVKGLNDSLESNGFPFRLDVPGIAVSGSPDARSMAASTPPDPAINAAARKGALFYRSALPQLIVLKQCTRRVGCTVDNGSMPIDAVATMLPQLGPISYIPMRSSPLVKTTDDVAFDNGMVASWNAVRPSEFAEAVRLPVRILKSVVSVPAELVKLRIDLADQEKGLAASQQAQMEAEAKLAKIQACVNAAGADRDAAVACFKEQ